MNSLQEKTDDKTTEKVKKKSKKQLALEKIAEEEKNLTESERQLRADQRKRAARKKRKQLIKSIVIALVVLCVVGFFAWQYIMNNSTVNAAPQDVYVAGRRSITSVLTGSGSVQPVKTYNVAATVTGDIVSAPIAEGSDVEKDDILYVIDSSDAETSIKNARNSLRSAQLSYDQLLDKYSDYSAKSKVSGVVTKLDVKVGDNVSSAQIIGHVRDSETVYVQVPFFADDIPNITVGSLAEVTVLDYYQIVYGTVKEISVGTDITDSGAITKNVKIEVKNPGSITDSTRATAVINGIAGTDAGTFEYKEDCDLYAGVTGEVASIGIAEGSTITEGQRYIAVSVKDLDNQLKSAEIQLDNARNSYNSALERLDDYTITAPIKGTVIEAKYNEGETIEQNSTGNIVAIIYDMSEYTFDMNIDELDIAKVSLGQEVKITCDARTGSEYVGHITKISKQGTSQNGVTSYPVTVTIRDETALEELLPGMNVDAEIVLETVKNVIAIPVDAVGRGNIVKVIKAEDVKTYGVATEADMIAANLPDGAKPGNADVQTPASGDKSADGKPDGTADGKSDATPTDGRPDNAPSDMPAPPAMPESGGGSYGTISASAQYDTVHVTLGISDDDYVEITEGLSEGDVVIVEKQEASDAFAMMMGGMGGGPGGGPGGGDMGGGPGGGGGRPGGMG